jgi:MFS family permease
MAVSVVGLVATFGMNFQVVVPPLAQDVLHSDAAGYGFLMTAAGLGSLAAAVALVLGGRPKPIRIALGGIVLGVASIALALSGSFPISLILMAVVGAGGIRMAATANATIQLSVPDGLRGRVMSVYTTVFSASVPVGGLLMGALASVAGIPIAIGIGGILSLASGLAAFVWWQRIRTSWTGVPPDQVASIYIGAGATVDVTPENGQGSEPEPGIPASQPATSSTRS